MVITVQFAPSHSEKRSAGSDQKAPRWEIEAQGAAGPARGAEEGTAKLLCYFSFLLMKVTRSTAVTTPNTICFMKELPFPLTASTENISLVEVQPEEPPTQLCRGCCLFMKQKPQRNSICLCSASTGKTDAASVRSLGSH